MTSERYLSLYCIILHNVFTPTSNAAESSIWEPQGRAQIFERTGRYSRNVVVTGKHTLNEARTINWMKHSLTGLNTDETLLGESTR